MRADSPHRLTEAGWAALWAHGVRTVLDLRHPHERDEAPDVAARPDGLATVALPLEDSDDLGFFERWGAGLATPHYYPDAFSRFADRNAALVRAVAEAAPGGVLLHCVLGRDRTGQASLLLLALLGVPAAAIAADHALSASLVVGIDPHHHLVEPMTPERESEHLAAITDLLATWEPVAYLLDAGVEPAEIDAVRRRLLEPA